jgi:aconitate hydratase 2/2-methylisocitrate dehydratase
MEEGFYNTYGKAGARTEMPGCSLCMGNQARVAPNTTVYRLLLVTSRTV